MEILRVCISTKKSAMRKIYFVLAVSFLVLSVSTNAQTEKKELPPPPPPKPKVVNEKVKFVPSKIEKEKPPVIVDEKIKVPPPPPPPKKKVKA
jgi:hypothetical protein